MHLASRHVFAIALCLVALSVVALSVGAPAAATSQSPSAGFPAASQDAQSESAFAQSAVDPDSVVMEATLATDGTAHWAIEYRVRLDDDNATAAFESVQADVEENSSAFTDRFEEGMSGTVRSAENATGRDMALRNVTVTADKQSLGQEYGIVTYRFTWAGFATADGDRIRAGDAISGLFLDSETTLRVRYPEGYAVESVRPRPDENRSTAVIWRGPTDFGPDEPRLAVGPAGGDRMDLPPIAGIVVGLIAVVATGWLVATRRIGDEDTDSADAPTGDDVSGGSAGSADATAADADADAETDDTEDIDAEDDGPPEELLSNEERVLRLLESEGGRIKQQQIATEFDWTDAKTSQVVGSLRDEDAVETFRIGRENVVTLPEESDL